MTKLQKLRAWARDRVRLMGHGLILQTRYSLKYNRFYGYIGSCPHCQQKFVLCLEKRTLEPQHNYSAKFSVEIAHLMHMTDTYRLYRQDTAHIKSVFREQANNLPQYYFLIGSTCYHLDRTVSYDEPMLHKKLLCTRLKIWQ